ncbi:hypothetical protein [Geminocystis sp. NIES-3709]|uniref:hypothetical protein n=1 Tax=Geminocystis sp. NIES-3709 TaxID=1617448 RepID=UPI0005FC854D|nr:hypothetical protein [Geminocystis sp. NIES-3709]BAQ65696.1 hypothetical protein GM3709_2461 [Geminocystis sp. NIES-3709]
MNHQPNYCPIPAPCIIESGILVNKEDIKRLINDLTQVRYIHIIDGVVQNNGTGWILEVFNDPSQATVVVNNSLYINIQSFDYLKLTQVSPQETHFDLIQDNRQLRLIPLTTSNQDVQTTKSIGFDCLEDMLEEVLSAKWDVQLDEDF